MTPEEQRTLNLLEAVEESSAVNQRELANQLGISLGLTNAYLQKVLKKGFLRATQVEPRRWLYFLTPQGALEKSRLSLNYLHRTLDSFRDLRNRTEKLLLTLEAQEVQGLHLCGDGDLLDVVQLCLSGTQLNLLSILPEQEVLSGSYPLPKLRSADRIFVASLVQGDLLATEFRAKGLIEGRHWIQFY